MQKPPLTFSVKVPTKTYLRKYVYAKHGFPLKLNYYSTLGTLVLCLLDKKFFDIKLSACDKDIRLAKMNDEIEITSSINTLHYKGHSLTPDKIIAINRYFENSFVEELHNYCRDNIKRTTWRPGYNTAINDFASRYGIAMEIDITMEALVKAERRYRKKIENNVVGFVPPQNSPVQMGFHYGITA